MIYSKLNLGYAILVEANLAFLGLGIDPPQPSLGRVVAEGFRFIQTTPWISTVGGPTILLAVLAANLLGDGLRERGDFKA